MAVGMEYVTKLSTLAKFYQDHATRFGDAGETATGGLGGVSTAESASGNIHTSGQATAHGQVPPVPIVSQTDNTSANATQVRTGALLLVSPFPSRKPQCTTTCGARDLMCVSCGVMVGHLE